MTDRYELTKHVCAACFGRVLMREAKGVTIARCAECGIEAAGAVKDICACGTRLNSGRDAGFRCEPNPDYIAGVNQEYVAVHRGES